MWLQHLETGQLQVGHSFAHDQSRFSNCGRTAMAVATIPMSPITQASCVSEYQSKAAQLFGFKRRMFGSKAGGDDVKGTGVDPASASRVVNPNLSSIDPRFSLNSGTSVDKVESKRESSALQQAPVQINAIWRSVGEALMSTGGAH